MGWSEPSGTDDGRIVAWDTVEIEAPSMGMPTMYSQGTGGWSFTT